MSFLKFHCAACSARIKAPFQLLGQSRSCPGCGYRFVVQMKAPPEAGPKLVPDNSHSFRPSFTR
jgi:DNA-directed RNA polymerase subunit RPC12/RpoP